MKYVYKIESEWDLGLEFTYYSTLDLAQKALKTVDWLELLGERATTEQLMKEGLVKIHKIKVAQ